VHTGFWWGDLRERDHLEEPGLDERIILKWISNTWNGKTCTGFLWLRKRAGGGALRVLKTVENFLTRTGWLLKKNSDLWSYYYYCCCCFVVVVAAVAAVVVASMGGKFLQKI